MISFLRPHRLQHTRLSCPSPTSGTCPNSCPWSWWYDPTIWSSVIPFSSCLQSFPASGSTFIVQLVNLHLSLRNWFLKINFFLSFLFSEAAAKSLWLKKKKRQHKIMPVYESSLSQSCTSQCPRDLKMKKNLYDLKRNQSMLQRFKSDRFFFFLFSSSALLPFPKCYCKM